MFFTIFNPFLRNFHPLFDRFLPRFTPYFSPVFTKKIRFFTTHFTLFCPMVSRFPTLTTPHFLQRLTFPLYSFFPHLFLSIFPLQSLFFTPFLPPFAPFSPDKPLSYTLTFPCFVVISTKRSAWRNPLRRSNGYRLRNTHPIVIQSVAKNLPERLP